MSATTKVHDVERRRQDSVLLTLYHRTRDPRRRDELVERFMPLACMLARRYDRRGESLDDLTQVAAIGLIKAVERFDPHRGIAFSSFAVPTIAGELKRHFRDRSWAVRPPRELQERILRLAIAIDAFSARHDRAPTVPELSERLADLDEEDVLEALHARRAGTTTSLNAPLRTGDGSAETLGDRIGADDDELHLAEHRVAVETLLRTLRPRERDIIRMRCVEDRTQAEIGALVGVSQMQISRIVRRSVDHMRAAAEGAEAPRAGELVPARAAG